MLDYILCPLCLVFSVFVFSFVVDVLVGNGLILKPHPPSVLCASVDTLFFLTRAPPPGNCHLLIPQIGLGASLRKSETAEREKVRKSEKASVWQLLSPLKAGKGSTIPLPLSLMVLLIEVLT